MLSGLLMSHIILGKLQNGRNINCSKEIAGRFLRIFPPYIAIVIFSTYILPHLGAGPQWNIITDQSEVCRKIWWRNIFMIHNWFGIENACLLQTHHISTDFMLSVISLPLIIFLHKHPKRGVFALVFLATASSIGRFYVTYTKQLVLFIFDGNE